MNAGEIEIIIAANYDKLEEQLSTAVGRTADAGRRAGEQFGKSMEQQTSRYIDRIAGEIKRKLVQAVGAISIANSFRAALEEGASGGSVTDAITAGVKATPLVNIAYGIMEAIGNIMLGTAAKSAELAALELENRRLDAMRKARIEMENALANRRMDNVELESRNRIQKAQVEGDLRAAAARELELELYQIRRKQQQDLLNARSEAEKQEILKRASMEREMATRAYVQRNQQIAQDEEDERQRLLREQEEKRKIKVEDRQREIDQLMRRIKDIEDQRLTAQQSVGEMQTSFGTFRYMTYTPDEQRRNAIILNEEVRKVNKQINDIKQQTGFQ